ncbi:erythropoietin receptor [Brachyhypopomus gauderio]|uniref:erythropoietin receptor n=1 Tax=Brachyhypopomus gauderio TaxID=698409 RepID=UPI004040EDBD
MFNERIQILVFCMLCLASDANARQTFENKVSQLLRDEPENIKCFAEKMRDLTCFWGEEDLSNSSSDQFTFTYTYQYQNENSTVCAVSELPVLGAGGRKLFVCRLSRIEFFVNLHLCVFHRGRKLYNRSLFIDHVFLLDPPANLSAVSTGKPGQLNVSWLPPALKYMDDSMMYEVRYGVEGRGRRKEMVKGITSLTLRGLHPSTIYKVEVRVKPDGITYNGYWSAWSDPEFGTTLPVDMDPLIVVLVLIISFILLVLSLTVLLFHHKFLLKKLWPDIPSPEHKFQGLFTVYKGDFQKWLGHSSSSCRAVHVYTEELPSPLEVLSEASTVPQQPNHKNGLKPAATVRAAAVFKEQPEAMEEEGNQPDAGGGDTRLTDTLQEPPHGHWLMEQLRTHQERPEVLAQSFLESQDTYVTLNQNLQHAQGEEERREDDVLEESSPLQALFTSRETSLTTASHSDLGSLQQSSGSGRVSAQSSFEYPNHTWPPKGPEYTYMAVADSGVSMDYSPMSSSRMVDVANSNIYPNEYKNDIHRIRQPLPGRPVHSGL